MDLSEILKACRKWQWFNFGRDPAGILDFGSLWNFRYHCFQWGIRETAAKPKMVLPPREQHFLGGGVWALDCFLVVFQSIKKKLTDSTWWWVLRQPCTTHWMVCHCPVSLTTIQHRRQWTFDNRYDCGSTYATLDVTLMTIMHC